MKVAAYHLCCFPISVGSFHSTVSFKNYCCIWWIRLHRGYSGSRRWRGWGVPHRWLQRSAWLIFMEHNCKTVKEMYTNMVEKIIIAQGPLTTSFWLHNQAVYHRRAQQANTHWQWTLIYKHIQSYTMLIRTSSGWSTFFDPGLTCRFFCGHLDGKVPCL